MNGTRASRNPLAQARSLLVAAFEDPLALTFPDPDNSDSELQHVKRGEFMKRLLATDDEIRTEYDLKTLNGGVRGKYFRAASAGTNLVLIDPELLKIFPNSESIN